MKRRIDTLSPIPATVVCGRAEDVPTPPDCSRVLCYIDPPYLNTTGYAHGFDRAAVVAVARRWADAGAHVVISEAEPIPELVADGWHFCDIADARIGQRRTFSKQQREALTSNRPLTPRHSWPARDALPGQSSLFGPRS
jgi:xanthine dehydrogenase molybdopterin-binding subunit B